MNHMIKSQKDFMRASRFRLAIVRLYFKLPYGMGSDNMEFSIIISRSAFSIDMSYHMPKSRKKFKKALAIPSYYEY